MGNDGGYIAKRSEMVKQKSEPTKTDYTSINRLRSMLCAISNKKLELPIVACRLGYLYSKEVVLGCLIKKAVPKTFNHIRKLRDVKDVKVLESTDPEFPFMCPLTRKIHNGVNKFVILWSCGCMMSEEALEHCVEKNNCPVCQKTFNQSDIVSLFYSPESIELKKQQIQLAKPKAKITEDKEAQEKHMLGKRNDAQKTSEHLDSTLEPVVQKKLQTQTNILDGLAAEGSNQILYKSLFHSKHEVENPNGLIFRNVRFGIR